MGYLRITIARAKAKMTRLLLGALLVPHPALLAAQVPAVAVERRLAERLGLRLGDTVSLGSAADSVGFRAIVAAIYEPAPDPAEVARREYRMRLHLADLAGLLGSPDRVDRLGVVLEPGASPDSTAAAFNRIAFGYRAFPSAEIASESSQTFRVVTRFHKAIALISVVASAVFLLCIMLLKVEERRLDAAVMRLSGIGRRTVASSLILEAALVAVIGSAIGVLLAVLASAMTNLYYARFFDTTLVFSRITLETVCLSVALSLVLGIGAGALAAWRLVRANPMVLWGRG
jgi:putative ABC transport system permease protein